MKSAEAPRKRCVRVCVRLCATVTAAHFSSGSDCQTAAPCRPRTGQSPVPTTHPIRGRAEIRAGPWTDSLERRVAPLRLPPPLLPAKTDRDTRPARCGNGVLSTRPGTTRRYIDEPTLWMGQRLRIPSLVYLGIYHSLKLVKSLTMDRVHCAGELLRSCHGDVNTSRNLFNTSLVTFTILHIERCFRVCIYLILF